MQYGMKSVGFLPYVDKLAADECWIAKASYPERTSQLLLYLAFALPLVLLSPPVPVFW